MTAEAANIIIAILGAILLWTVTVVGVTLWINTKFNTHERLVFRENMKTREMLQRVLTQHSGRIMRLELHNYGSTLADAPAEQYDG